MFAFVWCSASYFGVDYVGLFVFMLGDCFRAFELRFVPVQFRGCGPIVGSLHQRI